MSKIMAVTEKRRFQRVQQHIDAHPDQDLSVAVLSELADLSEHHFHRRFTALFGIGVHRYVQLVRLKRAAAWLAFRSRISITEIALESGYAAPESFTRAFRRLLGQSPSAFRKQPDWVTWQELIRPLTNSRIAPMHRSEQVDIVQFKETRVLALEHHGDPALTGNSIRKFIDWRKRNGLRPDIGATFNIAYNDPATTPPTDYRLDICVATDRDIADTGDGIVSKVIPGGRCATLRHVGSGDTLPAAVLWLYREWLPASGEALRDFPLFLQRVRFFPDVPEHESIVDIFLPLK